MKVKKGDEVVVIAGKDRGVKGKVIAANPETNRVVVEGVNRVTKHTAVGTSARGAKTGGIEHIAAPINAWSLRPPSISNDGVKSPLIIAAPLSWA